jgi:hypothetical protein
MRPATPLAVENGVGKLAANVRQMPAWERECGFSNGKPVERFDLEGPKNPKGEQRSVGRKRQLG